MIDPTVEKMSRQEQLAQITKVIKTQTSPVDMRCMKITRAAIQKAEDINAASSKRRWYYQHLQKSGILGFTLHDEGVQKYFGVTSAGEIDRTLVMQP